MSNRKIYRKIAKENKMNMCEVKQAMQSALDYSFQNPNNPSIIKAYQNQVPRKGEVPTSDEFIKYAVQKLRNDT